MKKLLTFLVVLSTSIVFSLAVPASVPLDDGDACASNCFEQYRADVRGIDDEFEDRADNCPDLACVIETFHWYMDALDKVVADYGLCVTGCPGLPRAPYPP